VDRKSPKTEVVASVVSIGQAYDARSVSKESNGV